MRMFVLAMLLLTNCAPVTMPPPADGDADPAPQDRTGWTATLSTLAHDVSGTVTIVDADTFRIDNFFYDGGGIGVYAYLAAANTNAAFTTGLQTGEDLFGTVYAGDTLEIDLPPGESFDNYAAISIWCVDVSVNFGSGTFIAP